MKAEDLDLSGHLRMPGLVNSHDHLEFNLFPTLCSAKYPDAAAWAADIYHPRRSPVREHLSVPKTVRLWWGGLKNLLSGVTTVCHHNPYDDSVFTADFPVRVVRKMGWAHSLAFEPDVTARYHETPAGAPFLIHCAEGTSTAARRELQELDRLGVVGPRTCIIHGVGLGSKDRDLLRRRRASLIWCPTSNLNMLGRTIARATLRAGIPISLATDSALSAPVDLVDEIRQASTMIGPRRLWKMVSTIPRQILKLPAAELRGDWIAIETTQTSPLQALLNGKLALVVVNHRVRLISAKLAAQAQASFLHFQKLKIEGRPAVFVDADVDELYRVAARSLGSAIRLAGKRVIR